MKIFFLAILKLHLHTFISNGIYIMKSSFSFSVKLQIKESFKICCSILNILFWSAIFFVVASKALQKTFIFEVLCFAKFETIWLLKFKADLKQGFRNSEILQNCNKNNCKAKVRIQYLIIIVKTSQFYMNVCILRQKQTF